MIEAGAVPARASLSVRAFGDESPALHRTSIAPRTNVGHSHGQTPSPTTTLEPDMLLQIVQNTPRWVFALFFALLWLGLRQTVSRQMPLQRVLLPALALTALSLYGVMSAWPANTLVLLCWLKATITVAWWVRRQPLPAGTSYEPELSRFTVPGSWAPLATMLGLLATKYAVGVALALHLDWTQGTAFAVGCALAYGAFSGLLLGRAWRLCNLAWQTERVTSHWTLNGNAA